jgi:hypothetical protein
MTSSAATLLRRGRGHQRSAVALAILGDMRTLYFDIDGTLLVGSFGAPKPALAGGVFEQLVRAAGFERLVCVGNVVAIVRTLEKSAPVDGLGMVLRVCQGVFADERWFWRVTTLIDDPAARARTVVESGGPDWFWIDDLAAHYCEQAALGAAYREHAGTRILAPTPEGDGCDLAEWLTRLRR